MKHSIQRSMISFKSIFKYATGVILATLIMGCLFPTTVKATAPCTPLSGTNSERQNYSAWATTPKSALAALSDGQLMSVTKSSDGDIVIMYFNSSYEFTASRRITPALPLYGGFFASSDGYYYIATGQSNPNESDDVEVYRITKYDSDWNEVAHASLFGVNTYIPFEAGSCDFVDDDRYLLVRTCHEMYKARDGYHHQANVTIQIDKTNMSVLGSFYSVANVSVGYVSHSFNQFIRNDNGYAVTVDHGDALPRSVVIGRYDTPIDSGMINGWLTEFTCVSAIQIPGDIGDNATGVSVGGFEYSDSAYLIAVNMVDMGDNYNPNSTRNAAVVTVPKSGTEFGTPVTHMLTNYAQDQTGVSTPRLVKIDSNRFIVLWSLNGRVYYTQLDGNGNPGTTYSFKGALSDCNPVVYNGNVVWYVYNESDTDFYRISTSDISQNSVVHICTGHHYVYQGTNNGMATMVCDKCGDTYSKTTASSITVFGKPVNASGSYWTNFKTTLNMDEEMAFLYRFSPADAEDTTLEVVIENENVLVYNYSANKLTPVGPGTTTVTFRMKYNPIVQRVYTFTVEGEAADDSGDDNNNSTDDNNQNNNQNNNNENNNNNDTPAGFEIFNVADGCAMQARMYNPNSGEHFYTGSQQETRDLLNAGWTLEGPGFITPTTGIPIYRLYSEKYGDHFYTTSETERDMLVAQGWNNEGVAFPSAASGKAMYRLYNPNAYNNNESGAHHFTTSMEEVHNLEAAGWEFEGIAWYSL